MMSKRKYLYHLFQNASFGFLMTNSLSDDELHGNIIDSIDLRYQPVHEPAIALTFFLIKLVVIIIGEFINYKLLNVLNKENSILNQITKLFVWIQMISYPVGLLFITATDFIHPVNQILWEWFCTLGWLLIKYGGYLTIFYSFLVAMMRYVFIFHNNWIEVYGKQRFSSCFYTSLLHFFAYCGKQQKSFIYSHTSINVTEMITKFF